LSAGIPACFPHPELRSCLMPPPSWEGRHPACVPHERLEKLFERYLLGSAVILSPERLEKPLERAALRRHSAVLLSAASSRRM
jgi:hypothetical protein